MKKIEQEIKFHKEKLWAYWRKNLGEKFAKHPLEIIQWEATRRCDLQCKHCGSPRENVNLQSELSTKEVISAFTQIKNGIDLSGFKFITITGGEPFLRADLFKVLALFKSFGWITTIQTNGNFLAQNPERIPELLNLGVAGIGLDLDGAEELHDDLRCRLGHWRQTRELVKKLLKYSDVLHTTVTTVVSKQNISSLPNLWKEIEILDSHRWRLLPIENIGRAKNKNLALDRADYLNLLSFVTEKRLLKLNEQSVQTELGCVGWFGKNLEGAIRPYVWSCIAGRTCLGIMYDGGISACAHIDRAFLQGNVRKDNIYDVWENSFEIFRDRPKQKICLCCPEKDFCTLSMHKLDAFGRIRECVFNNLTEGR